MPSASELTETYQKPAMRDAERERTGVPLALEPLKRVKETVELSPSSVPAAPKRVGELDVNCRAVGSAR